MSADEPTETFNLYRVIRGVLDSSPEPNPKNLVYEVFNAIPPKHRDAALFSALPQCIRIESNKDHRRPPGQDIQAKKVPGRDSWSPMVLASQRNPYAARVWTGKGEYKRLGDFQISDVEFMIQQGRQMEKAGQRKQSKYEKVRQAMLDAKVTYLKEVDPAIMVPIINEEV